MHIFYRNIIVMALSMFTLSEVSAAILVKANADGIITLKEKNLSYGHDFKAEVGTKIKVYNPGRMLHISRVVHYKEKNSSPRVILGRHRDKPRTSFIFEIDKPGIYQIKCLLHSNMKLQIKVDK